MHDDASEKGKRLSIGANPRNIPGFYDEPYFISSVIFSMTEFKKLGFTAVFLEIIRPSFNKNIL